jgi:hypothetical protein
MKKCCLVFFLQVVSVPGFTQSGWSPLFGSFLEPNRFTTTYDADATRLRLEAGFGMPFIRFNKASIGVECYIWSGLKTLEGFRFPVETADYFFGLNTIIPNFLSDEYTARVRLSHISSHLVDGTKDSVVGGSSSRFSREFVSFETEYLPVDRGIPVRGSVGIKYIFHQVTKVEPAIQFPVTLEYRCLGWVNTDGGSVYGGEVFASLSSAGGPQYPVFTGSLVFRLQPTSANAVDVYGQYFTGDTKYGVEGDSKRSGFEIGIRYSTLHF